MEVIINDIEEIKKYLTIDKSGRRIYIVAENITFNCAVPGNWHFNYTFSEGTSTDYNVEILAKKLHLIILPIPITLWLMKLFVKNYPAMNYT